MKRLYTFLTLPLILQGCDFDDVPNFLPEEGSTDYRQEMRDFVRDIGSYGRGLDSNFIVIAHGGIELVSSSGSTSGSPDTSYINALNGIGQDAVFYGYDGIDQPTSSGRRERLRSYLDMARDNGDVVAMVTDFAISQSKIDDSYALNEDAGYISFAADNSELDTIPEYPEQPFNYNRDDIEDIFEANNFLVLTNTLNYSTRQELVDDISDTNYDLVVMDLFFKSQEAYTAEQIRQLRFKADGGERLLIATVNIGEAESDRFYWQSHWVSNPPEWLGEATGGGDYRVNYWRQGWQDIIYGNSDSYIYRIENAGFDGAYLLGVDAYEPFEDGE